MLTKKEYTHFGKEFNPFLDCYLPPKQWFESRYQCEKCRGNMRRNEMIILPSSPPKFRYQCGKCKNVDYLEF